MRKVHGVILRAHHAHSCTEYHLTGPDGLVFWQKYTRILRKEYFLSELQAVKLHYAQFSFFVDLSTF